MKEVLAQTEERFEQGQATLRRDVDTIGDGVKEIEGRVTTLEDGHGELAKQVRSLEHREANVEKEVGAVAEKVENMDRSLTDFQKRQTDVNSTVAAEQEVQDQRLQTLEKGQVKLEQRVDNVETWQHEVSESLKKLQVTEESEARKPAQGFFKIPDRNKWFSGRQKELQDLDAKFNIFEAGKISHKKLAVCGLGGCGKTCLAIEYSWRLQETYQGGIFWMSAENSRTFEITLNDIALGIGTVGSNSDETLARTIAWLSSLQDPWLLIVDNMDEFDVSSEVQKLLEGHWKQTSRGHILITTRREAAEMVETMGFEKDNCIELRSMSEDESCAFLIKRTQQEEQPGIRDLAKELGGLPLALEQAAAHINVLHCAFEDYLKQYKKQKLKLFKRRKVKTVTSTTDKDRMAVHTTWSLNFQHIQNCEDPELAEAACAMMNIAAYLDPDDIPIELVNKGEPDVSQSPLAEYAESPLGAKQIFEVLTQFSLLQRYGENSWSVHRLVQEVISSRCSGDDERVQYLQSACRMLYYAFSNTNSPQEVLQQSKEESSSGKLMLWGKLARHACTVWRNMTAQLGRKEVVSRLMLAKEAAAVTHEASVYLSLNKQHTEASQAQAQTLECVANTEVTDSFMAYITSVHVPLREDYQKMLHAEMSVKDSGHFKADIKEIEDCQEKEDPETLRQQGNDLYKKEQYSEAISCYTRAINISGDNVDERLYSNRSLCYWKLGQYKLSLDDADKCIELNSMSGKAYYRRALALAELVEKDTTYCHYSGAARAAAALAIHHKPTCRTDAQMMKRFPNLNVTEISSATELSHMCCMLSEQDCTILLKEGDYLLDALFIIVNVQIVGVNRYTTVNCKEGIFCSPSLTRPVCCHFENLRFPQMSGELEVRNGSIATLYRCQVSNGRRGCKDYPNCQGGPGCVNDTSTPCAKTDSSFRGFRKTHGQGGYAGLQVVRGTLYVDQCSIIDCGGGGLLVDGEGTHAVVTNCEVMKHIQSGLEVRNGGTLKASGNNIHNNKTHGVTVGPGASTTHIVGNHIHNNWGEGVILLQSSVITIEANRIEHNGASGISVESSTLDLHNNEIANNWHWALFLKTHSSANICGNLVHSNKCGGLWFGFNQFGKVLIDQNVIRDHTGPAIHVINNLNKEQTRKILELVPKEFGEPFSVPPIITDRNVCQRNDTKQQHPSSAITCLPVGCAFCGDQHKETMSCGKCRKAQYCSKECQIQHWQQHKIICNVIQGDYSFRVSTEDTVYKVHKCTGRIFNPGLKGIKEGIPPDIMGRRRFIVKIQSGTEYQAYNPDSNLTLYDQTTTLDLSFRDSQIYHIIMECGILGTNHISSKKIFCYAKMEDNGKYVRIYTDHLAPLQEW
ncbi:uncharacterized protein LOC118429115 [Branchiostoma floridae]|uniref:Uncharacterized protein LOC118429115 n=1 Tax=Branchiostoma floridae TaxID=7739 RepID=A0A9J7M5Z3_BRAFL|nr:uncharacterized protein LOC118429115 [Branchiostoma floridae]